MPSLVSQSDMNVEEYVEKCINENCIPDPNDDWDAGPIEMFSEKSLKDYGKCAVLNGRVYITRGTTSLHSRCARHVEKGLLMSALKNEPHFYMTNVTDILIEYTHMCEFTKNKQPDGGLVLEDPVSGKLQFPVVFEVAFHNESLGLLVAELVHYLQIGTNVQYAMGFSISPSATNFSVRIIILQRNLPFSEKAKALLEKKLAKKYKRKSDKVCWNKIDFEFFLMKNALWMFDVNILSNKVLNREDLPFKLPLTLNLDDNRQITIELEITMEMFNLWQRDWETDRQRRQQV